MRKGSPDTLAVVFLSVWGMDALLGSLISLTRRPRVALDLCGGALFLMLGIVALGIAMNRHACSVPLQS